MKKMIQSKKKEGTRKDNKKSFNQGQYLMSSLSLDYLPKCAISLTKYSKINSTAIVKSYEPLKVSKISKSCYGNRKKLTFSPTILTTIYEEICYWFYDNLKICEIFFYLI